MSQKKKFWLMIIITVVISFLGTLIIMGYYSLDPKFFIIVFGLLSIMLFTIGDLLISKSLERYKINITIILNLLVILMLLGQLNVFSIQTSLMSIQTEILKETSVSNLPELVIWSSQGPKAYKFNDILMEEERIAIGATNIGKTIVPSATISLFKEDPSFSAYQVSSYPRQGNNWRIWDMEPLSYNTTWFKFRIKEDFTESIKFGKNQLKFRVFCPICRNPIEIQTIEICVYNQTKWECGED